MDYQFIPAQTAEPRSALTWEVKRIGNSTVHKGVFEGKQLIAYCGRNFTRRQTEVRPYHGGVPHNSCRTCFPRVER